MPKSNSIQNSKEINFFTADFLGIGGKIKSCPEDFIVEEILINPPLGEGNHFYLFFEKVGINTVDLARSLAKIFNVREWDIGYAGRKDSNSYSRQWFSVACSHEEFLKKKYNLENIYKKNCVFLGFKRGLKKLKKGALKGNRFKIKIRDVAPFALEKTTEIMHYLALNKFPNYYGPQRFGVDGNVSSVGRFLLSKNYRQAVSCLVGSQRLQNSQNLQETILNKAVRKFEESDFLGAKELWPNTWLAEQKVLSSLAKGNSSEKAIKSIPFVERNFFGSAFQSQLFNECLSIRLELDHFNSLLQGDIAVSDKFLRPQLMRNLRETEENKLDFSVNPSGPIYGERMQKPFGTELEIETTVLLKYDLCLGNFIKNLTELGLKGGRRSYRASVLNFKATSLKKDLFLELELSKGVFATEVLKEVMKV
jgi:tRNA pseudouridine13 synthase